MKPEISRKADMMQELEARKRDIAYIRAALTLLIFVLALLQIDSVIESRQYILLYLFVLLASNFVFIRLPAEMYEGSRLHNVIFLLDMVFVALGAYWLASLDFLFMMMIFVTVFIAAAGRSVSIGSVAALVINVVYFYFK